MQYHRFDSAKHHIYERPTMDGNIFRKNRSLVFWEQKAHIPSQSYIHVGLNAEIKLPTF